MGKIYFENGIDSATGVLMGSDPFYIRRYRCKNGSIKHIVQARPDRSGHIATEAERANRKAFGERFGTAHKGVKKNGTK
jgi:hypothetical protein